MAEINLELCYCRGFLEQLLALVANGDQQAVDLLVAVIRSDASHDAILNAMAELSGRPNPVTNRLQRKDICP